VREGGEKLKVGPAEEDDLGARSYKTRRSSKKHALRVYSGPQTKGWGRDCFLVVIGWTIQPTPPGYYMAPTLIEGAGPEAENFSPRELFGPIAGALSLCKGFRGKR